MRAVSFIISAVICSLSLSISALADDLDDLLGLGGQTAPQGACRERENSRRLKRPSG